MFFLSLSFVDDLQVHSKEIKMTVNNKQDAGMVLGMVLGHKCRIYFDYRSSYNLCRPQNNAKLLIL